MLKKSKFNITLNAFYFTVHERLKRHSVGIFLFFKFFYLYSPVQKKKSDLELRLCVRSMEVIDCRMNCRKLLSFYICSEFTTIDFSRHNNACSGTYLSLKKKKTQNSMMLAPFRGSVSVRW